MLAAVKKKKLKKSSKLKGLVSIEMDLAERGGYTVVDNSSQSEGR
jgi:hypothetical protein